MSTTPIIQLARSPAGATRRFNFLFVIFSALLCLVTNDRALGADAAGEGGTANARTTDSAAVRPVRTYINTRYMEWVRNYAKRHSFAIEEIGTGRVRVLAIDHPDADFGPALAQGNDCLDGLELITGNQDTFTVKVPTAGEIYYLIIFNTTDQVRGLIDDGRSHGMIAPAQGEDLMKKYPSFRVPRCSITSLPLVKTILKECAVSEVAYLTIDAYFRCTNQKNAPPAWLQEGMESDMQMLLCRDIMCFSVSYEDTHYHMTGDWAADIRKLLDSGSPQNKSASELMCMSIDALPAVFYQQMWSLCSYIRTSCGIQKGNRSKLHHLLTLLADGSDGPHAIKLVLHKNDDQLTRSWRLWAMDQH